MAKLKRYKTWIFDCDGVILDSNGVKTEAFREAVLKYGNAASKKFVEYHRLSGGISRFKKFDHFFRSILGLRRYSGPVKDAIERYGSLVRKKLVGCNKTAGLRRFLEKLPRDAVKIVISGGAQDELRYVLKKRNLDRHFDAIYGSPATKADILARNLKKNKIPFPAVFIGDTLYDYICAKRYGIDFIFMSQYSEMKGWRAYFKKKDVDIIRNLISLKIQI